MKNPHIFKEFDTELRTLNKKISFMGKECELQLTKAVDALTSLDNDLAQYIVKRDELINNMQQEIEQFVVLLLSKREPKASDLRHVLSGFKNASELERVGDYAANIAKNIIKLKLIDQEELQETIDCIIEMVRTAVKMIEGAMDAMLKTNLEKARQVWLMDDKIDHNYSRLLTAARKIMHNKPDIVNECTTLMFMGKCCERIGDHITNITENIYYTKTGEDCIQCFEKNT